MIFYSKQERAILLFHRILPDRDALWDPIDPSLFERTLKYIRKKFYIVSLNEMLFEKNNQSSKPLAALTFDDGYRDFIQYAIPILDEEKMVASIFVVTDCIDKNLPTWTYIIDHIFANSEKLEWNGFDNKALPEVFQKTKWSNQVEKMNYCRKFKQYIKWIPSTNRELIITSLLDNFNDSGLPKDMMMSWDEIRQIEAAGFVIGSHSVSHNSLATIADLNIIRYELEESAKRIKEETGNGCEVISYPLGSYDDRVKKIAAETGYKAGLAVNYNKYDPQKQDMYEIPRIELYSESWLKTKLRLSGTFGYLKKFYQ